MFMRMVGFCKVTLLALCITLPGHASAGALTLFHGQGANVNLPDIIPKLLNGEVDMDPTRFRGFDGSNDIDTAGWLAGTRLRDTCRHNTRSGSRLHPGGKYGIIARLA